MADHSRTELQELLSGDAASLFDALMAYLPMGLTIAEPPDIRILRVSDAGLTLLGRTRDRFEGIPREQHSAAFEVYNPVSGRLAAAEDLPLTRATIGGETVRNEEWLMHTENGDEVTLLCSAGPIRNSVGAIIGGMVAWADMSHQKQLEKDLFEAVRIRDQLLAELHHRIANHLHLVGAMLRLEARQTSEVPDLVEKIEDRLLALARGYSALRDAVEGVSAASFLSQVCEPLDTDLVRIELQADVGLHLSAQHAPTIGIVANEAICNALKYAFAEGRRGLIKITLSQEGDHFVLRVIDDGTGMTPTGTAGSGQGLALMQHLMKGIRGRLEISSMTAMGTTVTATWPSQL